MDLCKSCELVECNPVECDCVDCHDNLIQPEDEGYSQEALRQDE